MARINRLTVTKGFSMTSKKFDNFSLMYTDDKLDAEFSIVGLSINNNYIELDMEDLKLFRDMISHCISYTKDKGVNNEG